MSRSAKKNGLLADLTPEQVAALLAALVRSSRIELSDGKTVWRLSDQGAAAVLLKMDEFQGRIGTPGALARKGKKDEAGVPAALPAPVIVSVKPDAPLPGDTDFGKKNQKALLQAIGFKETCDSLPEWVKDNELTATRLNHGKMLLSARCWQAAYNYGYAFWIINATPPYNPVLVTTDGTDYDKGVIGSSQKGRGIGDCWGSAEWTWNGGEFVSSRSSWTGLCKGFAGGAWDLPTWVTEIR
jgi:hypothetical protein